MTSPTLSDLSPETLNLLKTQTIELPSWAFGNSGTRFRVFTTAGVPRDPYEKIDDVAQVNAFTGITPRVSLHIPWDKTDDYDALRRHAEDRGIRIGTINSNVFQDDDYKLGSLTNPDERVRAKAIAHHLECIDIMRATSAPALKIWLPDGTNYPGQDSIRERQDRLACSWSTSSSSPPSTTLTYRTGGPASSTAFPSASEPRWCWTPGTTHQERISSSSSPSWSAWDVWEPSTSTHASTPTTTSLLGRPIPISSSAS